MSVGTALGGLLEREQMHKEKDYKVADGGFLRTMPDICRTLRHPAGLSQYHKHLVLALSRLANS